MKPHSSPPEKKEEDAKNQLQLSRSPLGPSSGSRMGDALGKDPRGVSARASFRILRNYDGNSKREATCPFPVLGYLLLYSISY